MIGAIRARAEQEKLREVTRYLDELKDDLQTRSLGDQKRTQYLEQLKVFGREPTNSDPIYTQEGVSTLANQAFHNDTSIAASREALSCLANSMLLKEETRKYFANVNVWSRMGERLDHSTETHDEFLISRLFFMVTYDRTVDFEPILKDTELAKSIEKKLSVHASRYSHTGSKATVSPMDDNALTETAKLIFNLIYFYPAQAPTLSPSIPHLFTILQHSHADPPLKQPISSVLNALLNLDTKSTEWATSAFPKDQPTFVITNLTTVLASAVNTYRTADMDRQVAPLVTLITNLWHTAPSPETKTCLQTTLLPSEHDRASPLGRGSALPARLLQLSAAPASPTLRDVVSNLLFELSDSNPDVFVRNVGFGYASGFLMRKGIPLPQGAAGASAEPGINPVTGQRLDMEPTDDLPEMTEEEKEREAEKLFVLFERLKRTGVMDVKNPVEDAHRFEELDD